MVAVGVEDAFEGVGVGRRAGGEEDPAREGTPATLADRRANDVERSNDGR